MNNANPANGFFFDAKVGSNRARVIESAFRLQGPSMPGILLAVIDGGLMNYHSSDLRHWSKAASLIDKIPIGGKPDNLQVSRSTEFGFAINLKTAKVLNLGIPHSLMLRADQEIR